jgi:pSer/pThr/pTyr-binding forkhead associated (FHA) protein
MKLELVNMDCQKPPIVLDQFPVIVGLDPGADVCLDDSSIGHYQCMIDDSDGELMVWDLGTRSGTLINGVRVSSKASLRPGDELSFGKHRFVAQYQSNAAAPSQHGENGGRGGSRRSAQARRHRRPAVPV